MSFSFLEQKAFNVAVDVIIHIEDQLGNIERKLTVYDMDAIRKESQKIHNENSAITHKEAFLKLYDFSKGLVK